MRRERDRRRHRPSRPRRSPRIPLTSSNLIYPMRAPSNIAYNSPPPPYRETETPLPGAVNRNGEPPPAYSNSRDIRTQRQHNSRHVRRLKIVTQNKNSRENLSQVTAEFVYTPFCIDPRKYSCVSFCFGCFALVFWCLCIVCLMFLGVFLFVCFLIGLALRTKSFSSCNCFSLTYLNRIPITNLLV